MQSFMDRFRAEDRGAVTVDWVVLTAAVVGLGLSAYAATEDATDGLTGNLDTFMGAFQVGQTDGD